MNAFPISSNPGFPSKEERMKSDDTKVKNRTNLGTDSKVLSVLRRTGTWSEISQNANKFDRFSDTSALSWKFEHAEILIGVWKKNCITMKSASLSCERILTEISSDVTATFEWKSKQSEDEIVFAANVQKREIDYEVEFQVI